jgi:maltose/moltooligosaccharide transporter
MNKPSLSFWQIWNMSFGFFGIQFGFALQNANVSRIFQTLGANPDEIPILWVAAPLTGLLVQPIIGYLSDRTWHRRWGRRRPFFAIGAVLASLALIAMPNSPALWIAGGMLWIMDASINISMEPFRAFVGDMLPPEQRTIGFVTQSFFIGLGAVVASLLPYLFTWAGISNEAEPGMIPESVRLSFYVGAAAFIAAVMYTVFTTREYPPDDMAEFEREKREGSLWHSLGEMGRGLFQMPSTMRQLAVVQFFSWFALFCMWINTTAAVTQHIYGTTDTASPAYNEGANWVGVCFAVYNGVAALVAYLIPLLARQTSRKAAHAICLALGALGLVSIGFVGNPNLLLLSMAGVGVAWASIVSMPYAMLAGALPASKMGYYMGVFNFFIVLPQVLAAFVLGPITKHLFGGDPVYTVMLGGGSMLVAAILSLTLVRETEVQALPTESPEARAEREKLRTYFQQK